MLFSRDPVQRVCNEVWDTPCVEVSTQIRFGQQASSLCWRCACSWPDQARLHHRKGCRCYPVTLVLCLQVCFGAIMHGLCWCRNTALVGNHILMLVAQLPTWTACAEQDDPQPLHARSTPSRNDSASRLTHTSALLPASRLQTVSLPNSLLSRAHVEQRCSGSAAGAQAGSPELACCGGTSSETCQRI